MYHCLLAQEPVDMDFHMYSAASAASAEQQAGEVIASSGPWRHVAVLDGGGEETALAEERKKTDA